MKEKYSMPDLKFMLMNSFSTSADTLKALEKYEALGTGSDLEFVQNKAPKVAKDDLTPASWPADSSHEWCPPGHGDLYPALLGSGTLDRILGKGIKHMVIFTRQCLAAAHSTESLER